MMCPAKALDTAREARALPKINSTPISFATDCNRLATTTATSGESDLSNCNVARLGSVNVPRRSFSARGQGSRFKVRCSEFNVQCSMFVYRKQTEHRTSNVQHRTLNIRLAHFCAGIMPLFRA
jgi:hypothetical protein